ncbi:retrovirus-related pol polyprotein from transposon TNT 1-94 [Tanacetum coccineum]
MGKIKKESHPDKPKPSTNEKLQMLHMDLCGPMRVESINKKRYTWVKFLRTKDEAVDIIIKILKQARVSQNATVRYLRIDNDTEFLNQTLRNYMERCWNYSSYNSARTYKKNSSSERRNRHVGEDFIGHMLIFSKSPLFLWAKAVATACYTQNRSLIHIRLVLNQATSTSVKPPTKNDWDLMFQPMFDEYFKPSKAPSLSNSPYIEATNSPINSTNVKPNEEVAEFDSDTFKNPFAPPDTSTAESSSMIIDTSNMHTFQQPSIYTKRWTKDHPFTTIISDPSKPVFQTSNFLRLLYGAISTLFSKRKSQSTTMKLVLNLAGLKLCKRRFMSLSSLRYGN